MHNVHFSSSSVISGVLYYQIFFCSDLTYSYKKLHPIVSNQILYKMYKIFILNVYRILQLMTKYLQLYGQKEELSIFMI